MKKEEVTEYLDDDFLQKLEKANEIRKKESPSIYSLEDSIEILETDEKEEKNKWEEENPTEILDFPVLEEQPKKRLEQEVIEILEEEEIPSNVQKKEITIPEKKEPQAPSYQQKPIPPIPETKSFSPILESSPQIQRKKEAVPPKKIEEEKKTPNKVLQKKRKAKKGPWFLLLGASVAVMIIIGYKVIFWQQDSLKTNKQIESIIQKTVMKELQGDLTDQINLPSASNQAIPYLEVDFQDLIAQNDEVQGWIKVKNTNINYPFVQTADNQFYLKHSFNKTPNSAGWVFADFRNNLKSWDQNTILYAHGRLDNTMFGSLKKVVEKDWYEQEENHWIQISTRTSNSVWQVFSVYTIKPEIYYINPNFETEQEFQTFIDTLTKRSDYDFQVEVNTTDHILTLSSCYNDTLRVVLHAKLVKEEARSE